MSCSKLKRTPCMETSGCRWIVGKGCSYTKTNNGKQPTTKIKLTRAIVNAKECYNVLKQVHPDCGMARSLPGAIDEFLSAYLQKLLDDKGKKAYITAKDVTEIFYTPSQEIGLYASMSVKDQRREERKRIVKPKEFASGIKCSSDALVYFADVIEYFLVEFLEIAGDIARDQMKVRITPQHFATALENDTEFQKLKAYISGGGGTKKKLTNKDVKPPAKNNKKAVAVIADAFANKFDKIMSSEKLSGDTKVSHVMLDKLDQYPNKQCDCGIIFSVQRTDGAAKGLSINLHKTYTKTSKATIKSSADYVLSIDCTGFEKVLQELHSEFNTPIIKLGNVKVNVTNLKIRDPKTSLNILTRILDVLFESEIEHKKTKMQFTFFGEEYMFDDHPVTSLNKQLDKLIGGGMVGSVHRIQVIGPPRKKK